MNSIFAESLSSSSKRWLRDSPHARAFTRVELLGTMAAVTIAGCALLVLIAAGRSRSLETMSLNNLRVQATAHANYGVDWSDRQVTYAPDELGQAHGDYQTYVDLFGCIPNIVLGFGGTFPPSSQEGTWAFWLPNCDEDGAASASNLVMYKPFVFGGSGGGTGSYILVNAPPINAYVNGRFMDRVFFAPADRARMSAVGPGLASPNTFTLIGGGNWTNFSSYVMSPAAMFHPAVFGGGPDGVGGPFKDPNSFDDSYKSPTVSQCAHPELKTRIIEHDWLQGPPTVTNMNFINGKPYFFNLGADSTPMTLFFDGHTGPLPMRKVVEENAAVVAGGGKMLWMIEIPLGPWAGYGGYFSTVASFDGTSTSVHMFTRGGILGRDQVTAE